MLQTQQELDFPRGGLGNPNLRVINLQLIRWCACNYPLQRHRVSGGNVDRFENGSVCPLSCAFDYGVVRKGVYTSIWPCACHEENSLTNSALIHLLHHPVLFNKIHDFVQPIHDALHIARPVRQHALRPLRLLEHDDPLHAVHSQPQHALGARVRQRLLRLLLAQPQQLAHTCECRFRDELAQHADVLRIIALHRAHVLDHAFPQQLSPQRRLRAVLHVATRKTTHTLPREQGVSLHRLERRQGPSQQLGVLKAGEEAPTR